MAEHLFRDSPPYPIEAAGAEGSYIMDRSGKRYLDFVMGWCVGNVGWNKKQLTDAVKKFSGPPYVMPSYRYQRWEALAEKLVALMPGKSGTCFRATGGTEAVEIALKIARACNKRKKFIAFKDAYHGQSLACLGLVGLEQHEGAFGPFPNHYVRLDASNWENAAADAVKAIRKKDVAAFISEPIICNLGVIVPPKSFFEAVQEVCAETDTLFIMDEVATGFGRTGKWFGFEHFGLEPDVITVAKGFSSGHAAIGATIARPEVAESMRFDFSNYSTFGWHPLSTECAIANIDHIRKSGLVEKSGRSGKVLMKRLSEFCKPEGRGLCVGFGVKNRNIEGDCRKDGLIITTLGDRAALFPALDVEEKQINQAVEIIRKHY